jgi:phospholipase/carboxylesterase
MSKEREISIEGRLQARPNPPAKTGPVGLQALGLDPLRDTLLYIPASYNPAQPTPLALMFHGATGRAESALNWLQTLADQAGIILLAPASRRHTWDIIANNRYGPDIEFIDQALAFTFERYSVDPAHLAAGGFSDGASYALSVGLTNGDLFSHILAFSPGFMAPAERYGKPAIFISHGTQDRVLPIEYCSRKLVPRLQARGYNLRYREFEGSHTIPANLALEAVEWFLNS